MLDTSTDQAIALYILNKFGEEYVRSLIRWAAFHEFDIMSSERVMNVIHTWEWNISEPADETWEDES